MLKRFVLGTTIFLTLTVLFTIVSFFYFSEQGIKDVNESMELVQGLEGSINNSLDLKSTIALQAEYEKVLRIIDQNERIMTVTLLSPTNLEIFHIGYTNLLPAWLLKNTQIRGKFSYEYVLSFTAITMGEIEFLIKGILVLIISWLAVSLIILTHGYTQTRPEPDLGPEHRPEQERTTFEKDMSTSDSENQDQPSTSAGNNTSASEPPPPRKAHEKDFLYRFEKEISRSAEHALDISLCLIKNQLAAWDSHDPIEALYKEFVHDDLVFELKQQTLAVILPHHDIDQAMARMELFLRKAHGPAQEFFDACIIGLSSRSGRLVEAKRVYHESMIALKKADPKIGRMVGFKADPAKYRNFLTHQKV